MDLSKERHDNVTLADTGLPAGGAIDSLASSLKNFAGSIRHKAQLKKAIENIMKGNLAGLDGAALDRLAEAGVDPALYNKAPAYIARYPNGNTAIGTQSPNQVVTTSGEISPTVKYIAMAAGLFIIIYFVMKLKN